MSKRCELQKEYYQQYGNYKGNGRYCDKYVSWLEEQILALRIHDVVGQSKELVCPICSSENVDAEFNHYNFCRDCNHDWAK